MPDVKVPVRLRRETGDHPASVLSGGNVGRNDLPDEISGSAGVRRFGVRCGHGSAVLEFLNSLLPAIRAAGATFITD
jgi:hypothetical protein